MEFSHSDEYLEKLNGDVLIGYYTGLDLAIRTMDNVNTLEAGRVVLSVIKNHIHEMLPEEVQYVFDKEQEDKV